MDDEFFKKLRDIQKKERANSSLARVGKDFYKRTHQYLDEIRNIAVNDPFSTENDLLKNVQRIATEICEIREHKISDAAVMNIHRSYHLFQGKPQFDLLDTTPLNITDEEEKLYFSFVDVLKNHRGNISLDELTATEGEISGLNSNSNINNISSSVNINNTNTNTNNANLNHNFENKNDIIKNTNADNEIENESLIHDTKNKDDKTLDRLNKIKSAKVLENETYENINKQINKSQEINLVSKPQDKENSTKTLKIDNPINNSSNKKNKVDNGLNEGLNSKLNNATTKSNKSPITDTSSKLIGAKNSELTNIINNEEDQFVNIEELDLNNEKLDNGDNRNDDADINNKKNINITKSTSDKIAKVMILIFSEINSIIGVDKKVYGPFKSQDIVVMPDINAKILIKNRKGRIIRA